MIDPIANNNNLHPDIFPYLEFSKSHGYVLRITGASGKRSEVIVDGYDSLKLQGRFYPSGQAMTYRLQNIASCAIKDKEAEKSFRQYLERLERVGDDEASVIRHYREYFLGIIEALEQPEVQQETEGAEFDLKKLMKERFGQVFELAERHKDGLLTRYLLGKPLREVAELDEEPILLLSRSNYSQKQAIEKALTEELSVIEGPPGTGKTTTILSIIANMVSRGKRVVIVSKNNSAIDNIREELDQTGLPGFYLRLGNREIMRELQDSIADNIKNLFLAIDAIPDEEVCGIYQEMSELYKRLKTMESELNELIGKKNHLQEDRNSRRHLEKRREAYGHEADHIKRISKIKDIESLRTELDRVTMVLQRLDYQRRYGLLDMIRNLLIWHMGKKTFLSEGTKLQMELEDRYLSEEIKVLEAELKDARLEERQKELADLYEGSYIDLSKNVLKAVLKGYYSSKALRDDARSVISDGEQDLYKRHRREIRAIFPVILTTADAFLYNFSDLLKYDDKIDCIIMDEASQCDLLTGLPILQMAKSCVIVGDQKQLAAVTKPVGAALPKIDSDRDQFTQTLLGSVQKVWELEPTLLREHYRCDYSIINFCNKYYYDGELIIYTEADPEAMQLIPVEQGVYMVADLDGYYNLREIAAIEGIAEGRLDKACVITPFKLQGEKLRQHFGCDKETCGTIHTFQGRGQDTVYFSTVMNRSKAADAHIKGDHCLFTKELINVAVSRAKKHFILVSDATYMHDSNAELRDLIDYIRSYGAEIPDKTVCLFDGLYKKMKAYVPHDGLDNVFEETIYGFISQYCETHRGFYCEAKHPLCHFVTDGTYLREHPDIRSFVLHKNTHVDFMICNRSANPVLAIELDGMHHSEDAQQERDRKKDEALSHMGIPILRISSKAALTGEELERLLDGYLMCS